MKPDLMSLRDALGVDHGIVCAVGAGGKKSLLHALAAAHPAQAGRLAMTATARCTPPPTGLFDHIVSAPASDLEPALKAATGQRIFFAGIEVKPGRFDGVDAEHIARLHRALCLGLTLVKADGARMRWIKAPADTEPALVPAADLVLPVLSLAALGRPLDESTAHRPERVATVTGTALGAPVSEATYALLMSHRNGTLRGTAGARVVPVLNMIDDDSTLASGRRIARLALERTDAFDRVLLVQLRDPAAPRIWVCDR